MGGIGAGLSLAFAPLVWGQAVITEVYTLHTLGVVLVLWSLHRGTGRVRDIRTGALLGLALGGFANTSFALVGAALFIAAAMTITGLDKRIALVIGRNLGFDFLQPFRRGGVLLFAEGLALNLELEGPAVELVELLGQAVDLDADA